MFHMDTKNSPINRAMAAEIKGARVAAGLTTEQLAEATGISVPTLNRMSSRDIRDINITQMAAIAEAVKVPLVELIERAERRATDMSVAAANNVSKIHPREMTADQLDSYRGDKAADGFDEEADAPEDD